MATQNIQQSWQGYTDAWSDVDSAQREELLQSSVSPEIDFSNPLISGHGHNELVKAMLQFQEQFPGARFELGPYIEHHDQLLSAWTLYGKDGAELLTGHNYVRADHEGKIVYTSGFFLT